MMTKESGTTAISDRDQPVDLESPPAATAPLPPAAPGAVVLALLSLGWLAAMLWSAKAEISSSGVDSMAIASAAYALPGVISASLVSGAAVSLALANLLTRFGVRRTTPRFAAALAAGLATGLLSVLALRLSYGDGSTIMIIAGSIAAAATVGGIAGGLRSTLVVGAIVAAMLAVFAVGFALSYFKNPVLSFYGASATDPERYENAMNLFRWTGSLAGGLAAGLLAFGYLRIAGRVTPATPPRWPGYMIAGAGAGLLLLTAEVITRTAGAEMLRMASAISEIDRSGQDSLGGSRLSHAMVVLFVGALVATIGFGRTLRPAEESATGGEPELRDRDQDGMPDDRPADDGIDADTDTDTGAEADADTGAGAAAAAAAAADEDRTRMPTTTADEIRASKTGEPTAVDGGGTEGAGRAEAGEDHEPADRPEPVAGAGR
ncbi:hypothetical protein [Plantactinospora soyae]|uniref:MFS family permease n=1 Tax=Plantactinospora soyae TaxID=1544732 RepID=A0A927QZ86_9ACTN|nr:hypothetical protein [Plantactinospora soyae]MBE1487333.1 MFS family permease [Plantactinospora soyae]